MASGVPEASDLAFCRCSIAVGIGEPVEGARPEIGGVAGGDAEVASLEETHPTRVGQQ